MNRGSASRLLHRPSPATRVLGVVALIQGLVGLVALITILRTGLRMMGGALGQGAVMGTVVVIASVPFLVGPVLHLLFGWAALRRAPWAWGVGVVSSLVGLGGAFLMRAEGPPGLWLAWLAISVVTLAYLLSPPGRHALRS